MSCLDIQDSLIEYLLGDLDAGHRAAIEQHLAHGCQQCNAEVLALAESVDVMWQVVPPHKLSQELQREILARVRMATPVCQPAVREAQKSRPASTRSQLIHHPLAQALLAFAAGVLLMICLGPLSTGKRDLSINHGALKQAGAAVNLASPPIPASLAMSEKKYESTHLVSLRKKPGSSELRGHVLWDALAREIHIFCFGLQQPPQGTQYALWLIGPGIEVRAVERLEVDAEGICKAAVHWPEGDFRYAKVTLEPSSRRNNRPSNDVELTSNAIQPFSY